MICRPPCSLPRTTWVTSIPKFTPCPPKDPPNGVPKDKIHSEGNDFSLVLLGRDYLTKNIINVLFMSGVIKLSVFFGKSYNVTRTYIQQSGRLLQTINEHLHLTYCLLSGFDPVKSFVINSKQLGGDAVNDILVPLR